MSPFQFWHNLLRGQLDRKVHASGKHMFRPLKWGCDIFYLIIRAVSILNVAWTSYPFFCAPLKLRSSFYSTKSGKTGNWENRCIHGGGCHHQVHKTRGSYGSSRRNCYTTGSNAPHSRTGDDFLGAWKSLLHHVSCKSSTFTSWLLISSLLSKISRTFTAHLAFTVTLISNSRLFLRLLLIDYNSFQCLPMDTDAGMQDKSMHVLSFYWNSV